MVEQEFPRADAVLGESVDSGPAVVLELDPLDPAFADCPDCTLEDQQLGTFDIDLQTLDNLVSVNFVVDDFVERHDPDSSTLGAVLEQ